MPDRKPLIWVILSDWGKVSVDFDNRRMARALLPHCRTTGMTEERLYQRLFKDWRGMFDDYMRGQLETPQFRANCRLILDLRPECDDAAFDRAFADVFTPNEPIIELWTDLRSRCVRLVAASNVEELRHAWLTSIGIHDLFDAHCLSYKEGVSKPDPEFFRRALGIAGSEPDQTLFVDDHREFCEVALSLGIHAEVYDLHDHPDFVRRLQAGYHFA
jgi:FMN phosphatase YigB (HAD superfamily)